MGFLHCNKYHNFLIIFIFAFQASGALQKPPRSDCSAPVSKVKIPLTFFHCLHKHKRSRVSLVTIREIQTNVSKDKMIKWWHFGLSQRSSALWCHSFLQKKETPFMSLLENVAVDPEGRLWSYFTFTDRNSFSGENSSYRNLPGRLPMERPYLNHCRALI